MITIKIYFKYHNSILIREKECIFALFSALQNRQNQLHYTSLRERLREVKAQGKDKEQNLPGKR
ncbi:hypothetical protein A7K99_20780 [Tatumella citrea]|uniref:Uncharacterized protein n=1 Tax=Tatumella citrea TaxID=53336 RepID=A0A1Y0LQE5_TATCI|nr:hypothetical protein A7K98_20795 [Tatumella citrea]ARU99970.1 hypothetical protein A7K99_20780 [Tatumella citrea]